jgi:gliding motility-associated-like protein
MRHKYLSVFKIAAISLLFLGNRALSQSVNPLVHSTGISGTSTSRKSIDLSGAVEDASKRTLYSSTWKTNNGKVISRFSSVMINYPDANGNLQPVDLTLRNDANGWVADRQSNPCYFHSDRSTAINLGGNNEFVYNKNCTINGMALDQQLKSLQNSKIKLDLSSGIRKELEFVTSGIKTNYIFDKPLEGGITITEEVGFPDGCTFKQDERNGEMTANGWTGDYVLMSPDGKQVLLRFQAAECYDSKRHWCFASYSLQKKNGKNVLTTSVPSDWLSSVVYPVTVDPLVIGTTALWTGGGTVSCVYPKYHSDSILVTIPGGITISYFTIDYAYVSNTAGKGIPINDGIFYLSTPCAKTDTASCADSPGGGDTAGICYLVPYIDFHNPMTCCYPPSCSPQSFWLASHLARRQGGVGCDSNFIWYSVTRYTGFQYFFSAWLEGYTDSVPKNGVKYTPALQCSNSCGLTMDLTVVDGVPPYTITHPWAKRDTIIGAYSTCASNGNVKMTLKIPGCPYTCGTSDTIIVPPPIVVDACKDTVRNIPSQKVVLKPVPVITANPDTINVCNGTPINLTLNSCLAGTSFTWTGSDKISGTGNAISDNTSDTGKGPMTITYTIAGSLNGCADTIQAVGIVNPSPISTITGVDTLSLGRSETITATGGGTYAWSPSTGLSCTGCPNPIASPTATTTYVVDVTDSEGCQKTSTFTIMVLDEDIVVPNVITPNGDGKNDLFVVRNLEYYQNSKLTIFDRWGNQVYSSSNYQNNWDGGGQSDGVYYYLITLARGKEYHGFLQIIK